MGGEKEKQELQQTVNKEIRNHNIHLCSSRSLTEKDKYMSSKKKHKRKGRKQLDYIMVGRKMITHR